MTFTQTKLLILKEQMDLDPEFKQQMIAYGALIKEFGVTQIPIYLKDKLSGIDLLVKARMSGVN